jgi:hypothetical protein
MASTMCASEAAQGGFGSDSFTSGTGPAPCGTSITLGLTSNGDEAALGWHPTYAGFPPGLTLGNLGGMNASVSGALGDQPFLYIAFSDTALAGGDQLLLIENQSGNVTGGTNMIVDPSTTLFDLYDNDAGTYLAGGQSVTKTLDDWLTWDATFSADSVAKIDLGIGLSGGCPVGQTCPVSVTVNSLDVTEVAATPEPGTIVSVATGLLSLGSGFAFRRRRVA